MKTILIIVLLLFPTLLFALTEDDISISSNDIISNGGIILNEMYAVTPQAALLYHQFEQNVTKGLIEKPIKQFYVSAVFDNMKSTIYYYKFSNHSEANKAYSYISGFIWGAEGQTKMHPEEINIYDNFVIVISSLKSNTCIQLLWDKIIHLQVPDELIGDLQKRLPSNNTDFDTPFGVLASFLKHDYLPIGEGGPYFGQSWELNEDGKINKTFNEVLQIKKVNNEYYALWTNFAFDNINLTKQLNEIIANRKEGNTAPISKELSEYLNKLFDDKATKVVIKHKTYFVSAKGSMNVSQVIRVKDGYILLLTTEHWTGERGHFIIAYFWNKQ